MRNYSSEGEDPEYDSDDEPVILLKKGPLGGGAAAASRDNTSIAYEMGVESDSDNGYCTSTDKRNMCAPKNAGSMLDRVGRQRRQAKPNLYPRAQKDVFELRESVEK